MADFEKKPEDHDHDPDHGKHLCSLVDSGSMNVNQFLSLVYNPKFMCKVCGRVANNKHSLCIPVSFDDILMENIE